MNWDPEIVERCTKLDFQTPPQVAEYMVSLIPFSGQSKSALEPTLGMGNIVNAMQNSGFSVHAPVNFFDLPQSSKYDVIVMNPPFSLKYAYGVPEYVNESGMRLGYYILNECLKMSDYVIALMPWFTITDSDVRLREMIKFGLVSVTSLPRKTFQYTRIQTCILEFKRGYKGETRFRYFDY